MSNIGLALKAAIDRGRERQRLCPRKLHLRFMTQWGGTPEKRTGVGNFEGGYESHGLLIHAAIAAKDRDEFERLNPGIFEGVGPGGYKIGERMVPWEDLDARANELVGLVDQCVSEVEQAVGIFRNPQPRE